MTENMFLCTESDAVEFGLQGAVILTKLAAWVRHNKKKGAHFHEGRTWSYNTRPALAAMFPFINIHSLDRLMRKFVKDGILLTGNFAANKYNRTTWYAFSDEERWEVDSPIVESMCDSGQSLDKPQTEPTGRTATETTQAVQRSAARRATRGANAKTSTDDEPSPLASQEMGAQLTRAATAQADALRAQKDLLATAKSVFAYHCSVMGNNGIPRPWKFTPGIKRMVLSRLKEFTPKQLNTASERLSKSDFHRGRDPASKGKEYCHPRFLYRSQDKVDEWLNTQANEVEQPKGWKPYRLTRAEAEKKYGGMSHGFRGTGVKDTKEE